MTMHSSKSTDKEPCSLKSVSSTEGMGEKGEQTSFQVTQYSTPRLFRQIVQWVFARYLRRVLAWLHRCLPLSSSLPLGFALDPNDHIGSRVLAAGTYEGREIQAAAWLISKFDSASGVMIDVGAHMGIYSCALYKCFKRVIAFEPNPRMFLLLRYNCFNIANICFRQLALSDRKSSEHLKVDRYNTGHAELIGADTSNSSETDTYVVATDTLDAQLVGLDIPVRFIKIDVEGEEYRVLRGAEKILRQDRPIVSFECVQEFQAGNDVDSYDFLISLGYRIFFLEHAHPYKYKVLNALRRLITPPELKLVELAGRPLLDYRLLFAVPIELVVDLGSD